jgi:hypothetical protein
MRESIITVVYHDLGTWDAIEVCRGTMYLATTGRSITSVRRTRLYMVVLLARSKSLVVLQRMPCQEYSLCQRLGSLSLPKIKDSNLVPIRHTCKQSQQ